MLAFEYDLFGKFKQAILRRYYDQIAHLELDITRQEVLSMLVLDKHVPLLRDANKLVKHSVEEVGTKWLYPDVNLTGPNLLFKFKEPLDYLLPAYTKDGPVPDQAMEVQIKVDRWVQHVAEINKRYATVRFMLDRMREELHDLQEVRFYFPPILVLMDDVGSEMDKLRNKLTKSRMINVRKKLDPEFRPMLKIAHDTIVRSTLFPKGAPSPKGEVKTILVCRGAFNQFGHDIEYM